LSKNFLSTPLIFRLNHHINFSTFYLLSPSFDNDFLNLICGG